MIPFHPVFITYLAFFLIRTAVHLLIEVLNQKHLKKHGTTIPPVFAQLIDGDEIEKTVRYTAENIRFDLIQTLAVKTAFILMLLFGIFPRLAEGLNSWSVYSAGLVFFGIIGIASMLFGLPFDYYRHFVLEEKYGFNTQTRRLWLMDLAKSVLLLAILGTVLISAILFVIQSTGNAWWIWAWGVFFGFQLLIVVIYPVFIAPLFNRFTPVEDVDLKEKIETLVRNEAIDVRAILEMDASKRTRHTNAYFSGLGRAKRIVLFDSLLNTHRHAEIVAVLAHEIGHLKKRHITKRLFATGFFTLVLFFLASKLIVWESLFAGFGFSSAAPYTGLFLISVVWEPLGYFLSPLGNLISRRYEREADDYALGIMKSGAALIDALKKLARSNLSNLHPHPAYVWFNYSHPPLLERIRHIEANELH